MTNSVRSSNVTKVLCRNFETKGRSSNNKCGLIKIVKGARNIRNLGKSFAIIFGVNIFFLKGRNNVEG